MAGAGAVDRRHPLTGSSSASLQPGPVVGVRELRAVAERRGHRGWRVDSGFGAHGALLREHLDHFEPRTLDPVASIGESQAGDARRSDHGSAHAVFAAGIGAGDGIRTRDILLGKSWPRERCSVSVEPRANDQ